MFPTVVQVGKYLSSYAQKFLKRGVLNLGCKVMGVERSDSNDKWRITWSSGEASESAEFDHLIIACGFFSQPYVPPIPGLDTFPGTTLHSSSYTDPSVFSGKHIAIIGGSLSSAEVAGDIAHLAASVHHVITRPLYVYPKYIPLDVDDPGSTLLPWDFVFDRNSLRPSIQQTPQEQWKKTHELFRSICGDPVGIPPGSGINMEMPPYAAISDLYANYVRSECIKVHAGRLTSISGSQLTVTSDTTYTYTLPSNITDIIFATGFRSLAPSSFLPPTLLSDLDFIESDTFLPFLLHRETLHPSFPNAGFVGYYRGPFWGIIELQARWCAGLFSGSLSWPSDSEIREGIFLEKTMRNSRPRVQFPRGQYVGFGIDLANEAGVIISPPSSESSKRLLHQQDIFAPHLFTWLHRSDDKHPTEPRPVVRELEQALYLAATSALFVAAAVFRSLHGSWIINRTCVSRHPDYPSGVSTGTAEFIPREASSSPNHSRSQETLANGETNTLMEYLYSEQTELTTSAGLKLTGTRQYIYQYDEPNDKLEIYFVRRDSGSSIESLFHRVDFEEVPLDEHGNAPTPKTPWRAKASHWCSPDMYQVQYTFSFKGADIEKWKIEYEVKGPKKDYSIETWYTRES